MIVTESTLERALFHIFWDRDLEAGSELRLTDLQYYWLATGLRRDDLRDAIRCLSRRGYVALLGEGNLAAVQLTKSGWTRLEEFEFVMPSTQQDIGDVLVMTDAKHRRSYTCNGTRRDRRSVDEENSWAKHQ